MFVAVCIAKCPKVNDYTSFICKTHSLEVAANDNIIEGYAYTQDNECFFELMSTPGIN